MPKSSSSNDENNCECACDLPKGTKHQVCQFRPLTFRERFITPEAVLIVGGIVSFAAGLWMAGASLYGGIACIIGGVLIAYGIGLYIEKDIC